MYILKTYSRYLRAAKIMLLLHIAKTCEGVVLFCRKTMNYIPLS